jgi:hypothetical protein
MQSQVNMKILWAEFIQAEKSPSSRADRSNSCAFLANIKPCRRLISPSWHFLIISSGILFEEDEAFKELTI